MAVNDPTTGNMIISVEEMIMVILTTLRNFLFAHRQPFGQ